MKTTKFAYLIAISGMLAFATSACSSDVGDDNSSTPDGAADGTTVDAFYVSDSASSGDTAVAVHDANPAVDAPAADSTADSGAHDGGVLDGGEADATVDATTDAAADAAADVTVADTGAIDAAAHDTGAQDTGAVDAGEVDANISALNAHCAVNNGDAGCTPTELLLIEHDTNLDGTGKGGATAFGCYDCMVMYGCVDDKTFASDVDHECGDTDTGGIHNPTLSGGDPTASCLSLVSCIFANHCTGPNGSGTCYCGTAVGAACTVAGGPNGGCLAQEEDGTDSTSPPTVNSRFTDISYAGGMANTLFACAGSNTCPACF